MQVLCIEDCKSHLGVHVKIGQVKEVTETVPLNLPYRGLDMWYKVLDMEPPVEGYHVSHFIPLSNIEGETYAKRKNVLVEI